MKKTNKLSRAFFAEPVLNVAQNLIGKQLVYGNMKGIITETEAYGGKDDPASHAYRGITPRTEVMFGEPGFSYVYFIYGMYHCLNVVTEAKGQPSAVLIRGLWLDNQHFNGPGKLCRHLGITKQHNAIDLVNADDFYVEDISLQPLVKTTPRIGIKVATERPWRFVLAEPLS